VRLIAAPGEGVDVTIARPAGSCTECSPDDLRSRSRRR
jgi:hypothetical protein